MFWSPHRSRARWAKASAGVIALSMTMAPGAAHAALIPGAAQTFTHAATGTIHEHVTASHAVSATTGAASREATVKAERSKKRSRSWAFPVRPGTPMSGTFGEIGTYWPTGHAGIDFDGELGDPIFAILPGRVITAEFNHGGYGNLIIIRRGDGTEVRYAHLERMLVNVGDRVSAGTRIARMGSTGQSTGAHLHLEVRVNNGRTPTNPASVWAGKRPGTPAKPPAWSCAKYGGCTN